MWVETRRGESGDERNTGGGGKGKRVGGDAGGGAHSVLHNVENRYK